MDTQEDNSMKGTTTLVSSSYLTERLAIMGISPESDTSYCDEDEDVDLQLEEFSQESEYSQDEEDDDGVETETKSRTPVDGNDAHTQQMMANRTSELGSLDDGDDIESEDERDLMKEIRDEIENKVKAEMKEELAIYKQKLDAIDHGEIPGDQERKDRKEETEENMDPKIIEALEKMRKLDRILTKKLKREREVKRDRIILEKRIREEIECLKPEGREHKDVQVNTEKFVALALPPSHNEGVPMYPAPPTPVFQTQLNENEFLEHRNRSRDKRGLGEASTASFQSETSSSMNGDTSDRPSQDGRKHRRKKKKKDFIKRNKELAANADETHIAMTEEERKRVGELLTDLDLLPELPEEMDSMTGDDSSTDQLWPTKPGEGFCGDQGEMVSMMHIDGRLRQLMPEEDFKALMSPQESVREPPHHLFTRVDARSMGDVDRYGERALIETKEQRDMHARLQRIEEELAKFHNPDELEIETPTLNEDTLKGLIDQCVRSLSRSSYTETMSARTESVDESTPRSEVSSVVTVLENPPHLTEEVLQRLLAEAHFPLSSKLEVLREEEEVRSHAWGQEGQEADVHLETISAETWKTVAESEAYENGYSDLDIGSVSRTSSRSSLRSSESSLRHHSETTTYDPYESTIAEDKRLILPEIHPNRFLVSQGVNNQLNKSEANFRGNPHESTSSQDSINNSHGYRGNCDVVDVMMAPRPPSSERRMNSEYAPTRPRTATPVNQLEL